MIEQSDCLEWLRSLPDNSCDLVFSSPPYEECRTYSEDGVHYGISKKTEAWVSWMTDVVLESLRVCSGLVAFVVEGQTKNFRYSAGPILLMADLARRGTVTLRKPPIFHRVGIPGSGGPDWLRNDYEFVLCATNGGRLQWSDNTAMGHPPKWVPGGAMSHRHADGRRKNDRDHAEIKRLGRNMANGIEGSTKGSIMGRRVPAGTTIDGVLLHEDVYLPPKLANPGNVVKQMYSADHVISLLDEASDVIHCKVGGGVMGSRLCHENEAPFPEALAEFFIRSFCPRGGVVADPFAGSGTTLAVAERLGRTGIGCDMRASQVELTQRRLAEVAK